MQAEQLAELQNETREIIADLLNDGSDPDALYIIEHHIAHEDFAKLEKIAVEIFKLGFEVADAEEFEEEGRTIYGFDALSEAKLNAEVIDAEQAKIIPIVEKFAGIYDGWGTYFEDPNGEDDEFSDDVEFFDED